MKIKIANGFFSNSREIDFEPLRDNPFSHFEGKNNGCLYCSSWQSPKCLYHDKKKTINKRGFV